MKSFMIALVSLTVWSASTLAAQTWPHPIPCRVQDSNNADLFVMTLGDANTPLAQGTFDPVKDEVTLKNGTVKPKYYEKTLGLPYYQPIDKTRFPLPPSGWCTWYYYYAHITADEVKKNARWISDHLKDYGARVIQIDDEWQRSPGNRTTRDWTWVNKRDFPQGMTDVAELLKRVFPAVNIRPLDLFPAHHNKRIWDLKINHLGRRYDVVGVFNFGEIKNETMRLKWADLGLPSDRPVHVFDFWNEDFLGTWKAGMTVDVAPTSCRVLTLMPSDGQIQLLSTNRHITQGWVDLIAQHYNPATQTYRGQSHVIKNDPYELRFVFPKGKNDQVTQAAAHQGDTSLAVTTANHQGWSQVRIDSPRTTDVTWEVHFKPATMYHYRTNRPEHLRVERVGLDGVDVTWSEQYYLNNGYQVYLDDVLQGYTPKASFPLRNLDPQKEHTVSVETVWEDGSASRRRARTTFTLKDMLPPQLSLLSLDGTDQAVKPELHTTQGSITIAKTYCPHALLMRPGSAASYRPKGLYHHLTAQVGLGEQTNTDPNVVFVVLGDDRELYRSQPQQRDSVLQAVDIDITGVQSLTLKVEGPVQRQRRTRIQAAWMNPMLKQ